jgi:thiol:disulfide interchange protein DsbG
MTSVRNAMQVGLKKSVLGVLMLCVLAAPAMAAATKIAPAATSATPNAAENPVLANMIKAGAKLYYMGTRSNLDGWLIVKDGGMQIVYSAADKKNVIIGAMFDENGEDVTSAQVKKLMDSNKDLSAMMLGAAQEQQAINQVGTPAAGTPVTSSTMPSVTVSPGERLYQELSAATGVTLGTATPKLLMIMDPNCPHCQATWRNLRDAVFKKTLQVRLIPIAAADSDNERAAGQLLHAADPLNAWDKYVGADKGQGDKTQLAGTPDQTTITALRANHTLIDNWHIDQTPYLVYRGKDGKVKIVVGEPDKVSSILSDLVP